MFVCGVCVEWEKELVCERAAWAFPNGFGHPLPPPNSIQREVRTAADEEAGRAHERGRCCWSTTRRRRYCCRRGCCQLDEEQQERRCWEPGQGQ